MHTMPPKQRSSLSASALSRVDSHAFPNYKDPAFIHAVNRVANYKVLSAIKSGKLRVVKPLGQPTARYTPRMDLVEDPSSSTMVAMFELPGISGNDIKLSISDGAFTVWGERLAEYPTTIIDPLPQDPISSANNVSSGEMDGLPSGNPRPNPNVFHQELCYGTFSRTVPLPKGMKDHDLKADLRNGMLIVTYPKQDVAAESSSPKSTRNAHIGSTTTIPSPPMPMLAAGTASQ